MTVQITAGNVLGIHLVEVDHPLRISDVGRDLVGTTVSRMCPKTFDHFVMDKHWKESRKEMIKSAKLYSRLDARVKKPQAFALAYQKGIFDKFPEQAISVAREMYYSGAHVPSESIDLTKINRIGGNDIKYGDPATNHIQITQTSAENRSYYIVLYSNGNPVLTMDATLNTDVEEWYT